MIYCFVVHALNNKANRTLSLHNRSLNYFAHYYFDQHPTSELHNTGLVLPDLVRNFVKGKKLKTQHLTPEIVEKYPDLSEGTMKHFSRDSRFHGSQYFQFSNEKINRVIAPVFKRIDIPRYWFAGHLLSEMMIDRVLIKKHPEMIQQFYTELEKTHQPLIHDFLGMNADETTLFEQRMDRFLQARYLEHYVHDSAMAFSLHKVFVYAGAGPDWTDLQQKEIEMIIPEVESIIFESLNDLIQEMH